MNTLGTTIDEKQRAIIEKFEAFGGDRLKKYAYLIDLGRRLPPLDPRYKTDKNLLGGCQVQIWLHQYMQAGKLYFEVACDSAIILGIAALLIQILSGQTLDAIRSANLYCLEEIGLQQHLSPQRANGLAALVARLQSGQSEPE